MSQSVLKKYKKGDVIFRANEEGETAFIIDSGRVEIFTESFGAEVPVNTLGPGEIFGEMAILDHSRRSASARALEEVQVSTVSRAQFEQRIDAADPIVRLLLSILLKRMRGTLGMRNDSVDESRRLKSDEAHRKVIEKIKFEAELFEALVDQQFMLYYQPIVKASDHSISGFEALIRWKSETRGMVRPDLFIGVAEETSLIVPIGRWIFEKACENLKSFQNQILQKSPAQAEDLFVAVNISGKQFSDINFFYMLETIPTKFGVKEKNIKLEITEKILLEGNIFFYWIEKCRNLGFPVSLDDFGTGYSMLSYLSEFNVSSLKIDQSFVRKAETDEKTRVIIKAIIDIAKGLKIETVAEGVETEPQAKLLKDMGCDYLQGYYFGKPVSYSETLEYLNKNSKVA